MTIAEIFVPHARKASFNQGTLILMSLVSSAVCCPRFETEETEINTLSGKENSSEFLSFLVHNTVKVMACAHMHAHT